MLQKFTAFQMAAQLYKKCKSLKLPRFLQEQLLRASSSVALNLAEGSGNEPHRIKKDSIPSRLAALGSAKQSSS